jgi:hypothetical protein
MERESAAPKRTRHVKIWGERMNTSARRLVVVAWVLLSVAAGGGHAQGLQRFQAETAARAHCPADIVVWLNTPSGIYHFKGMRWYGNTLHGAYVCKREADQAGDRATRNGQ